MRIWICTEIRIQTSKKLQSVPVVVLIQLRVVSKSKILTFILLDLDSVTPYIRKSVIWVIVLLIFPESPEAEEVEIDFIEIPICDGLYWEIFLCYSIFYLMQSGCRKYALRLTATSCHSAR